MVLRALAKDPKERFASVADFQLQHLEQASQRALTPTVQLGSSNSLLLNSGCCNRL